MNRQSWQQSRPTGDWETAYRPVETAKKQKAPKKPKQRKGWGTGRVVAAALACAIVGGVGGGALTAHLVDSKWEKTTEELQSSFQSQLDDLANAQNAIQHGNGSGATVDTVSNPGALTPAQVYAQNVQSVVAITNQGVKNGTFGQESFTGTGSGFILTADGYVLTNHHVIDGAQTITVTLYDGTEYTARLVGSDSISDVALLKIEAENLPAVTIGDSDGRTLEHPLAPASYAQIPERFPDALIEYADGTDAPGEAWPYLLPGPGDALAGNKAYRARWTVTLEGAPSEDHDLALWLVDTTRLGGLLRIAANGEHVTALELPIGATRGSREGDATVTGTPLRRALLELPVPAAVLQAGQNVIELELAEGGWVAWDALGLFARR